MKQTYLKNGYIVTMAEDGETVYDGGGVLIEDDKIKAVGKIDPKMVAPDAEVIELNGRYVLPGFVNTHVHTSQQISRGVGDDVDFVTWLHKRMWPFESNMTEEDSYMSTLATCLELIRSGVTSFAEPGGQFVSGMCRATAESGLRGKLAKSVMDCGDGLPPIWQRTMEEELEQQVADLEKYHNTADGRVQVWFGLRTIFNNTDELCVRTKELADKYGVGIHMHVAEALMNAGEKALLSIWRSWACLAPIFWPCTQSGSRTKKSACLKNTMSRYRIILRQPCAYWALPGFRKC